MHERRGSLTRRMARHRLPLGVDADDVFQGTFLVAAARLDKLAGLPEKRLEAWLLGVSGNLARTWHRSAMATERPRGSASVRDGLRREVAEEWWDGVAGDEEPEDAVEVAETLAGVRERASPDEGRVMVLRHLLGLTWQRVAFVVGRSEAAARKLSWRGMERGRPHHQSDRLPASSPRAHSRHTG